MRFACHTPSPSRRSVAGFENKKERTHRCRNNCTSSCCSYTSNLRILATVSASQFLPASSSRLSCLLRLHKKDGCCAWSVNFPQCVSLASGKVCDGHELGCLHTAPALKQFCIQHRNGHGHRIGGNSSQVPLFRVRPCEREGHAQHARLRKVRHQTKACNDLFHDKSVRINERYLASPITRVGRVFHSAHGPAHALASAFHA
jgi:hypothetical protein